MNVSIIKVPFIEIQLLRHQYLDEQNCQIRYHACHERGWSDSYLISVGQRSVGYGSIKGKDEISKRDAVFEFYLIPAFRNKSSLFYKKLIEVTDVKYLECQTNDLLHSSMVYEFSKKMISSTILFRDHRATALAIQGAAVRSRQPEDLVFEKNKSAGAHVMLLNSDVVASGGFLLHYNEPFADLYMETRHDRRGNGYASYLLQEIKRQVYAAGRVPAARCSIHNPASKAALQNAGLEVAGHMIVANL